MCKLLILYKIIYIVRSVYNMTYNVCTIVEQFLREPPGGPEGVRSTEPKANPVRWRPRRGHAQIVDNQIFVRLILIYSSKPCINSSLFFIFF